MGCPLSPTTAPCPSGTTPPTTTGCRAPPRRRPRRRRGYRRRRVHRSVDGHYLAEADPSLRIAVVEAETAGFGASGRNGGWCSALFPASLARWRRRRPARPRWPSTRRCGAPSTRSCSRPRGGHRRPRRQGRHDRARPLGAQLARARADVDEARALGHAEDDVRLLDAAEATGDAAATRRARRDVHAGLRGHPPPPAGARPGRRGRAPRRHDLRADPGDGDRARAASPTGARCGRAP